jgi:hypothetical protein
MTVESLLAEPTRVDEPRAGQAYAEVLSQVASEGRPVIVRRNGADLAAIIPVEFLELVRDILARPEVEKRAAQIDWSRVVKAHPPPQGWFDDKDDPFAPEEESAP